MIVIENIYKSFIINKIQQVDALKNINLNIQAGQVVVLKGSSGSGKSTLLSLIAALSKPTSGKITVDSKVISKLHDNFSSQFRRSHIGFIFQKYNLIPSLTVFENVIVPLIPNNPDKNELRLIVDEVLSSLQILNKKEIAIQNLSGGEQQRVAIARSLINNPKIILADEPTANLDEKLSLQFIDNLRQLKKQQRTIIVATHDPLFFNLDFVDQIIELKNGQIV